MPIRQSFAITGSMNQQGQVQSIGAVNERIEGFFDVCQQRGDDAIELLTGKAAGARGSDGRFPEGSINALVEARLASFAESARTFAARSPGPS